MKRAERVRERVREAGRRVERRLPAYDSPWRDVGVVILLIVFVGLPIAYGLHKFVEPGFGNKWLGLDP